MTSIKNTLSLVVAALATPNPTANSGGARDCGDVNVFYTGFPPYHPLVAAQGWDPVRVDIGLRNDTLNMINAGYNVHVVWTGIETPISVLEDRMDQTGVTFDLLGIGWGMRGATLEPIVERFEDLVDMYKHKAPDTPIVFNHSPESFLWSVSHRIPMKEDCEAAGKPGKLLGYEEICDSRCDHDTDSTHSSTAQTVQHNEL